MNFIKEDMKSLSLSKEQKAKLLEMCVKLFPKYNVEVWDDSNTNVPQFEDDDEELKYRKRWSIDHGLVHYSTKSSWDDEEDYIIEIHWFEFCIKELTPELFPDEESCNCDNTYLEIALINMISEHPVDYLYKEFKKL